MNKSLTLNAVILTLALSAPDAAMSQSETLLTCAISGSHSQMFKFLRDYQGTITIKIDDPFWGPKKILIEKVNLDTGGHNDTSFVHGTCKSDFAEEEYNACTTRVESTKDKVKAQKDYEYRPSTSLPINKGSITLEINRLSGIIQYYHSYERQWMAGQKEYILGTGKFSGTCNATNRKF